MSPATKSKIPSTIEKTPTGISGLDNITNGGLPRGRTTLVAGGAGSGKTLLGMEFLVQGAMQYGEPGVAMTFEETPEEITSNMASLGHDLNALIRRKKIAIDYVHVERRQIEETGEYDLEGLFIRLDHAIKSINAKRVLLDTIEVLFAGLRNEAIVRSELRRLFRWLKDRGVTSIITAEAGDGSTLTRHGLEEYVADCVIFLDHRVNEQISTRRIRVVKYRGSTHGTNEYPFLLDHNGLAVLPITALGLNYKASSERVFTGVPGLDDMMGGLGFFRGSSVLVTGTAGTGKSSIASSFVDAACARGERALYFAFEESPDQILRNMRSLGIRLDKWIKQGLLKIIAVRPTTRGLENHLASICKDLDEFRPKVAAVDPITNLISIGTPTSVKAMLTRLVDILKGRQITALFTNLMVGDRAETNTEISSLMDTWIMVRDFEIEGSRRRLIYVLKSRGMEHSADVREFTISSRGVRVTPVDTRTVESNRKG
ncbi:MAG TPA: circadian clock protein KaiC [Terriglobales bacterium]|nr:circadian clock protein KaiC [Terriglobales bacterium]